MARPVAPVVGVYEREVGSGLWCARYRQDGKLVRKSFGRDRAAAIAWVEKARTIKRSGEGIVPTSAKQPVLTLAELASIPNKVSLGDLCDGLLKAIQDDPEAYRDQHNPPIRIGRIKHRFGSQLAASIRPHEIKTWISALKGPKGKQLAVASRNRYKTVFSSIYVWGKEHDMIDVNPARGFKRWKESPGVIRYLDPQEETRLRKVLQSDVDSCLPTQPTLRQRHLHHIYELDVALGTGVRRSEQYRMTWPDVNFDRKEIVVPKTKFGPARVVLMNRDVEHALRELQKMPLVPRRRTKDQPSKIPANSVFPLRDNKSWFNGATRRAKIQKFRWHDCRHTFCSRLVQRGVNLKVVQELAGHKTIAMTARYAHLAKANLVEALALLNRDSD
jgi:site-specific recombinase XerD